MLARQQTWLEIRSAVTATLVFVVGVLLASIIHRQLFSTAEITDWLWFSGFTLSVLMLGLITTRAFASTRTIL
jgi:uncharacterized membrane protein YoaK (UPF0700 family)